MKTKDLAKLCFIILGILFFGGLLVSSISSFAWNLIESQGIELTSWEKSTITLAVILMLAIVTHKLIKKPE